MKSETAKDTIRKSIIRDISKSKRALGGQQCGIEILPVILKSEQLGIEISINHFRQNHKNLEYAKMLFDLIIDDLIK